MTHARDDLRTGKPEATMLDAIRRTLEDCMAADDSIVVLGEEAASGGLFGATRGLLDRFGKDRVLEPRTDDQTLLGTALGMAMSGLRPVIELELADRVLATLETLGAEIARLRYTSGAEETAPLILRLPVSCGTGAGPDASLSPEALLAHLPGLVVVAPSSAEDASGFLRAALAGDDPVVILEPARLYRAARGPVASDATAFGKLRVLRSGEDATVFSWGGAIASASAAAKNLAAEDIDVTVVDVRSLAPLDEDGIVEEARRTGRVVIAHDAPRCGGFGAEIAATIAERAVLHLEAPILRVTGVDSPAPRTHEATWLPGAERIRRAVEQVVDF